MLDLLREDSPLVDLWCTVDFSAEGALHFWETVILELSGQLTAAAVSPEPAMLCRQWMMNLQSYPKFDASRKPVPHDYAIELAVLLVAYERKLIKSLLLCVSPVRPTLRKDGLKAWLSGKILALMTRVFRPYCFTEHNRAYILTLAEKLAVSAEAEPERMRISLKKIAAAAGFRFPVDEPPFQRIGEDGKLTQHGRQGSIPERSRGAEN